MKRGVSILAVLFLFFSAGASSADLEPANEVILEEVINEAGLEPVVESAVEEAPQEVVLEPAYLSTVERAQAETQE